jgi:phosphoribosylamine--glycine ligase
MPELDVLVVGNGGREYELTRQLSLSPATSHVYTANGNAGTATLDKAQNVPLTPTDIEGILQFVAEKNIGLVVIGPEAPLITGLSDALRAKGVAVFGPSKQAAQLEASKAFAADFMQRQGIAQPELFSAHNLEDALSYIKDRPAESYVLKADGLAGGKGVVLPQSSDEAKIVLQEMFDGEGFDGAGKDTVVIQERLHGPEVSAFAVSDGTNFVLLPFAQDHKRLRDDDKGPNTGGMGAYAPVPDSIVSEAQAAKIRDIAKKSIDGMAAENMPYQGVLYIGLMLAEERGSDPVVIEYNVRFGDPETEILLPVLSESGFDVADMLLQAANGDVSNIQLPATFTKAALTVCLAAPGYPENPIKGSEILGLDKDYDGAIVHHAGTKLEDGKVLTAGGRVLYVTGFGDTISEAASHAYAAIGDQGVHFADMQYRRDIGHQARD